jgi:hypothetical protein
VVSLADDALRLVAAASAASFHGYHLYLHRVALNVDLHADLVSDSSSHGFRLHHVHRGTYPAEVSSVHDQSSTEASAYHHPASLWQEVHLAMVCDHHHRGSHL